MRRLTLCGFTAVFSITVWGQGAIAFTHAPEGAELWIEDVFTMNADGSNVKALTRDGRSQGPSWSPDGRRILFIHSSASNHPDELYVMDADGANRRLIRRIPGVIHDAAWSPDGKTLALSCAIQSRANLAEPRQAPIRVGLHLLAADGSGPLRLVVPGRLLGRVVAGWEANWRSRWNGLAVGWSVHVANADGSKERRLSNPARDSGSPAWSPDGKLIAFDQFTPDHRGQQIFLMAPDGSHVRQVTTRSAMVVRAPNLVARRTPGSFFLAFRPRSLVESYLRLAECRAVHSPHLLAGVAGPER